MNESQFLGILMRLSVPEREFLFRGGAREVAEDGGAGRETIATSQESEAPAFLSNLFYKFHFTEWKDFTRYGARKVLMNRAKTLTIK